ncbi:AraC-like DNA-binding protein [Chitinophaga sp. W3I9]|uniref:helix-turn-helix domain-containing protein n=1 Tax=unclassified Chitinophaga TaxID=2619133 RepID=UPI003D1FCC1A
MDLNSGVAGFSQKDYQLKRHAHFPIEVAFSLSGQLTIETDTHKYANIQSAIINSNVPHTFSCLNSECQLYFINPVSYTGKNILKSYLSQNEDILIDPVEIEFFRENHILAFENKNLALNDMDSRIQRILDWIKANYATDRINIARLAEVAFLSESRLSHLFKKEVGTSINQYILWKKIEMAIKHALEGASLTKCAYSSGFADSSHFIKTFQKMFGIYPSFAIKK